MEKKPRYFLVGGNGELTEETTSEKLPKLSDKDIDKLYSKLIKLDGKYKNFKGSKRDYCFTVSGLIINFLKGNNLLGKEGGAGKKKKELTPEQQVVADAYKAMTPEQQKEFDAIKKKAKEDAKKAYDAMTPEQQKEYNDKKKADKKAEAKAAIKYLELKKDPTNIKLSKEDIQNIIGEIDTSKDIIKSTVTKNIEGQYREQISDDVFNIFKLEKYKNLKLQDFIDYAKKYEKVIETFCDSSGNYDLVSTKNFLFLTPFDKIFTDTPDGNKQKEEYRDAMVSAERSTAYDKKKDKTWKPQDSATLEIENDYYKNYLEKKGYKLKDRDGNDLTDDLERVALSSKIFSKGESSKIIDFSDSNITEELKGNAKDITKPDPAVRCVVDLTKVLGAFLDMFYVDKGTIRAKDKPKKGEIAFYHYTSNAQYLKTKQSHLCTIGFNLNKVYNSMTDDEKTKLYKIVEKNKDKDLKNNFSDIFSYYKSVIQNTENQNLIKDVIFKYFGEVAPGNIGKDKAAKSNKADDEEDEYMFNFNISNKDIAKKFYMKQANKNLHLDTEKPIKSYTEFFRNKNKLADYNITVLNQAATPVKEPVEYEILSEEPDLIPEEYFTDTAKELLKPLVDKGTYTQDKVNGIIKREFEEQDPQTKRACDEVAIDLFDQLSGKDPDIPEITEEQVKQEAKEQAEKERLEAEAKKAKKKYESSENIIIKNYQTIKNLYTKINELKEDGGKNYYEIEAAQELIDNLLERNKEMIERIRKKDPDYEPPQEPKPDQPVVAAGRRFYFRRF